MPTLQANATINLIAAGATEAKGTVSWEIPTIPPGN